MKTRKHLLAIVLLLVVVVCVLLRHQMGGGNDPMETAAPPADLPSQGQTVAKVDDSTIVRPEPDGRARPGAPSPLDQLKSPDTTPENDVRLLALLFADYASVFKRVPLGTHQEIVAALRGKNPRSIQYIPDDHPAVNAANEITDRWDKPFFFHVISKNAVEIVSAGPDGELFTDDDIRDTPPHASVEPALSMVP